MVILSFPMSHFTTCEWSSMNIFSGEEISHSFFQIHILLVKIPRIVLEMLPRKKLDVKLSVIVLMEVFIWSSITFIWSLSASVELNNKFRFNRWKSCYFRARLPPSMIFLRVFYLFRKFLTFSILIYNIFINTVLS